MAFEWHQKIPLRLKLIRQDILLLPRMRRRTRLKYDLNGYQVFQTFLYTNNAQGLLTQSPDILYTNIQYNRMQIIVTLTTFTLFHVL